MKFILPDWRCYDGRGWRLFIKVFCRLLNSSFFLGVLLVPVFLFLAVVVTWPAFANLHTKIISDGGDLFLFAMNKVHTALSNGQYPFGFTTMLRYPVGFEFGVGIDAILGVLTGAFLLNWFEPFVAYNFTVLLLFTFNAVAAFMLFRYVSKSRLLGILGAVSYGFSFFVIARAAGHLNLMSLFGFPFMMLANWKIANLQKKSTKLAGVGAIGLLYLALWLISWGSVQFLIVFLLSLFIVGLCSLGFYFHKTKKWFFNNLRFWWAHLLFLPLFLLFFLYPFYPTVNSIARGTFKLDTRDKAVELYDVAVLDFFLPNNYNNTWFNQFLPHPQEPNIEKAVFFGVVELVLVLAYFFSKRPIREKLFLFVVVFILFILALGVVENGLKMPYAYLVGYFPFSGLAEVGRLATVISLFMTLMGILALSSIKKRFWRVTIGMLMLAFLVGERVNFSYFQAESEIAQVQAIIQNLPGQASLNLPLNLYRQEDSLIPVFTGKNVVGGYIHWSTDNDKTREFINKLEGDLLRFGCDESIKILPMLANVDFVVKEHKTNNQLLNLLRSNDISSIIVHKSDPYYHPQCQNARVRLDLLLDDVTQVEQQQFGAALTQTIHEGVLDMKLYFPTGGSFTINGISVTNDSASISAFVNDSVINFDQNLIDQQNGQTVFTVRSEEESSDRYSFWLDAGSSFQIITDKISQFGAITLWYSFDPNRDRVYVKRQTPLELIHSDNNIDIYEIH